MTRRLTATEAKAKFLALLDEAAAGEEIEITKHGRPVARLVPAIGGKALKGAFSDIAWTANDDDLLTTGEQWEFD